MKQALVLGLLASAGCSQIFGLDPPNHVATGDAPITDTPDTSNRCLQDHFDAQAPNPMFWSITGVGGAMNTVINNAQQLAVTPPPVTNSTWGLKSIDLDLTAAAVEVEVVQPAPFGVGEFTGLTVQIDASTTISLISLNDQFESYVILNGAAPTGKVTQWSTIYRFWRIGFDGASNVTFQTRKDATSAWVDYDTLPSARPPTQAKVLIGVGVLNTQNTDPGDALFDNFLLERDGCVR
jgi:hypothetical protein